MRPLAALAFAGAALFFLLELALSVLLLSLTALSRVALRRLNVENGGRMPYLEEIKTLQSTHRAAVHAARQASLLAAGFLTTAGCEASGFGHAWSFGAAAGVLLGVLLIDSILARYLALREPRTALRVTSILVRPVYVATWPFLAPVHAAFRRWPGTAAETVEDREEDDEEVEAFIEVGEREGILEKQEGDMVRGIVDLDETLVREVMVPRTDIVALGESCTVAEARKEALASGHSRYPVVGEGVDNVVGVLHVRDLLRAWQEGKEDETITALVRPAVFVPETRTVAELLREIQQRTHMALVVDEYGGLAGLVTLEDLLEEIVGEIRDEHDTEETSIEPQADGSFLVAGSAHVEELEDLFAADFGEREYDTVGGFVVSFLGRVPDAGETFSAHGLQVEVLEADPKRVYRVRVAGPGTPRAVPEGRP